MSCRFDYQACRSIIVTFCGSPNRSITHLLQRNLTCIDSFVRYWSAYKEWNGTWRLQQSIRRYPPMSNITFKRSLSDDSNTSSSSSITMFDERTPLLSSSNDDDRVPWSGIASPPNAAKQSYQISNSDFWWIMIGSHITVFLGSLDGTVVATLLSPIGSFFNESEKASYLGTSYLLSVAAFTPLYGRLSDILGRKGMRDLLAAILENLGKSQCCHRGYVARTWIIELVTIKQSNLMVLQACSTWDGPVCSGSIHERFNCGSWGRR
jgi:hypothetical protein